MSFFEISDNQIQKLNNAEIIDELKKQSVRYLELMNVVDNIKERNLKLGSYYNFCCEFCSFYKINGKAKWKEHYFNVLESMLLENNVDCKNSQKTVNVFEETLEIVSKKDINRVEASFTSKLLHTVNPDVPIFDSNVRLSLSIKDVCDGEFEIRLEDAKKKYQRICDFYFLSENEVSRLKLLDWYNKNIGENTISDRKKIDFILWELGKIYKSQIKLTQAIEK